ncbi:MAG TPA: hypothetical protein VGK93_09630 [Candidatus Eisenbacteria bacterium]|jgi:hypothetical protein
MRHAWVPALLLLAFLSARAGGKATATTFTQVTVSVSGPVEAVLVDGRGRRTGWYDGRVEDIPGCTLEAIDDDVAKPQDYKFKFSEPRGQTYRLLIKPCTDGEFEISVTALLTNGKRCVAQIADDHLAGERQWRLRWITTGGECAATITPVGLKKAAARSAP